MWDPGLARWSAKGLKSKPPFHAIVERPQPLMLQKICRQSFRYVTFSLRKYPFLLALRRWGRFARNVPSGEERGETDVFACYVTFGDKKTVHLTLSLKKGKCTVFKPRQVQDVRIVKFKEIESIKKTMFLGGENFGWKSKLEFPQQFSPLHLPQPPPLLLVLPLPSF